MLYWAFVFLVIAIVAAVFGFGGIASTSAGIAKILFFIFLVLTLVAAAAVSTACDAGTPTSAHVLPTDRETSTVGPGRFGYGQPHRLGRLEDPRINESSGLVASRSHTDVLWTHNDSGGGPYIYALDTSGRIGLVKTCWYQLRNLSLDWHAIQPG